MTHHPKTGRHRRLLASGIVGLATLLRVDAQVADSGSANQESDKAIVLSPFVVEATEDSGYSARDTLAGTRVRTELKDVASAISVVTTQFLKDTGAKNNSDLLVYTPSTEVAGLRGNFSGMAGSAVYQENTTSTATRVRGLDAADNTRDYFLTDIPWDGFNVGRVDLQRGPNSILFGTGSPAGIINTSVNDASFKSAYGVENRFDNWGSVRTSVNINQEIIPAVLAIRVAALQENDLYEQKPAYKNDRRYYGALRFDPKLFGEDNHTSIRLKYENGRVESNNPRSTPPVDEITPWFHTGTDQYGNLGLNKLTINQFSPSNRGPDGVLRPGDQGSNLAQTTFQLGGWAETRSYWPDVLNYYEVTPAAANNTVNPITGQTVVPNAASGTPIMTITAQPNTGLQANVANALGQLTTPSVYRPFGIPSMSQYAANIGFAGTRSLNVDPVTHQPVSSGGINLDPAYPQKVIPGSAYFADTVLTDPSIFNFYKYLLDGPNKHESQKWDAINLSVEQSFFGDRLAFQFAYDRQNYSVTDLQWMTGSNYAISIDVNQTYADGSLNPNVGRPYVGNAASAPGLNYTRSTLRNTWRFTPTGELRAEDFFGKSALSEIFGHQRFTGLYEDERILTNFDSFAEYATTPSYITDNFNQAALTTSVNTLASNREFDWIAYLGPNMYGSGSASGANLRNLNYVVQPPLNQFVRNFNATWNKPTDPSTPGYVDPTAPFTYTDTAGRSIVSTQIANAANYVGWQREPIQWMTSTSPTDFPNLVEAANRTRYRDISKGFTWQGYFLGGDLVPAFGWRKDSITNFQTIAQTDQTSGFTSLNYPDNVDSRTDVAGISRSWGVVYHLPKKLVSKLPGDMTISLEYNKSQNFKADASRLDFEGNILPNAKGDTREYGFVITALNEKVSLKVDWFKTKVANATLADTEGNSISGLGNNAYFIADGAIWGYAWATSLQDGLQGGQVAGSIGNYWDYALNDGFQRNTAAQIAAANAYNLNGGTSPNGTNFIGGTAIINAWVNAGKPGGVFGPNYFAAFNLSPPLNATLGSASGNLRDSYPLGYNDSGGPNPGGGSNFGNHQITVDNLSKGVEIELTANPTKNWNVSLNYTHVNAIHSAIDAGAQQFIGDMTAFMNGPGGQVREWFNGGTPLGLQWDQSVVAQFTVELNGLGHAAPEVSPWRLNAVSTYTFDHGPLKNVFLGGAFRMEAGRIIGYHYDPNFKNTNFDDPRYAVNLVPQEAGLTNGGLNPDQPFIGPNDHHLDAWIGYRRKVAHNLDWRIQVNLRSVGEKDKLVAARVQPDGSLALARIQEGMGWELTNSFDF
ncbi:MAG TPA: TonB-dependent receptor plug domain-containing protein [Candidatus Didemnitutus sp.]|nr:TonB-dependent receptor plug domain-containing protein [Candidatus Didemnitutus sp.]